MKIDARDIESIRLSISPVFKPEECIDLFSMEFRDMSKGRILILCSAVKV